MDWISTKDRCPASFENVLFYETFSDKIRLGYYDDASNDWSVSGDISSVFHADVVIFWIHLPPKPKFSKNGA